jgi:cell division protein FtsL
MFGFSGAKLITIGIGIVLALLCMVTMELKIWDRDMTINRLTLQVQELNATVEYQNLTILNNKVDRDERIAELQEALKKQPKVITKLKEVTIIKREGVSRDEDCNQTFNAIDDWLNVSWVYGEKGDSLRPSEVSNTKSRETNNSK